MERKKEGREGGRERGKKKSRERKVSENKVPLFMSFPVFLHSTISGRIIYKSQYLCLHLPFIFQLAPVETLPTTPGYLIYGTSNLRPLRSIGLVSACAALSCSAAFYTVICTFLPGFSCPHTLGLFPFSVATHFLLFYKFFSCQTSNYWNDLRFISSS